MKDTSEYDDELDIFFGQLDLTPGIEYMSPMGICQQLMEYLNDGDRLVDDS